MYGTVVCRVFYPDGNIGIAEGLQSVVQTCVAAIRVQEANCQVIAGQSAGGEGLSEVFVCERCYDNVVVDIVVIAKSPCAVKRPVGRSRAVVLRDRDTRVEPVTFWQRLQDLVEQEADAMPQLRGFADGCNRTQRFDTGEVDGAWIAC